MCSDLRSQGITDSPSVAQADVAGLQLALALSASVYFMRENKRLGIGAATCACRGVDEPNVPVFPHTPLRSLPRLLPDLWSPQLVKARSSTDRPNDVSVPGIVSPLIHV